MVLLLGTHIYLTIFYRLPQRHLGLGLSYAFQKNGLTTLTTTLAATLGTGNIIGVGTAVFYGGPGAVFWCWLTGLLGMATTYAESHQALSHQHKGQGGTMYLLHHLLGHRKMACFYAGALCLAAFLIGCTTQVNAIVTVCHQFMSVPDWSIGLVTAVLTGMILLPGSKNMERCCMALVPIMSILFTGSCFYILIKNYTIIGSSICLILKSAFSPSAIGGGVLGFTVTKAARFGIARGLFTNEAGLGTAGVIAGQAPANQIKSQASLSMCATFFDTVFMCGVTGIVVVIYVMNTPSILTTGDAGSLAAQAFSTIPVIGPELLALEIACFAVATLIGWSYIGWQGASYLGGQKGTRLYQFTYLVMIVLGASFSLEFLWEMTDFINIFLVLPCVYCLWKITLLRASSK